MTQSVHTTLSPLKKEELEEFFLVHCRANPEGGQWIPNCYPPHLWQPPQARPISNILPFPEPAEVMADRSRRLAEFHAETFDKDVANGQRWIKASLDDGTIVGAAMWLGPKDWAGLKEDGTFEEAEDVTGELGVIRDNFATRFENARRKLEYGLYPKPGSAWCLFHLFVLPSYQHQGIGTALLDEGLAHAKPLPVALESTEAAQGFYHSYGFVDIGNVSAKGWKDGFVRDGEEGEDIPLMGMVWEWKGKE